MATRAESVWTCVVSRSHAGWLRRLFSTPQSGHRAGRKPERRVAMPGKKTQIPDTIERSPKKAERTWKKAHDSAVESYGEGERAHRTAFASLKHSFEKVGDHWEEKDSKGPSDDQAARSTDEGSQKSRPTAGGVDANASKEHLL